MEIIPEKRRYAVLVSVSTEAEGLRISLDDVVNEDGYEKTWTRTVHITNEIVSKDSFVAMQISEEKREHLTTYILARLVAFFERGEN